MRIKYAAIILIIFLTLSNLVLLFKTYNLRKELNEVYKNSDFLKRKGSKMEFDSYNYNFGTVKLGKTYNVTFSFTNTDTITRRIRNVKTSCGCTSSEWTKNAIIPGEKGKITLNYTAGPAGEFLKYILVQVEKDTLPIQLEIKGDVLAY